jgi:hypothetical protein
VRTELKYGKDGGFLREKIQKISISTLSIYQKIDRSAIYMIDCAKTWKLSRERMFWRAFKVYAVQVRRNTHGSYQSLPWDTSRELNHGVNEVFQSNRFSQGYLYVWWNLKAFGANICNWKWMKWLRISLFFLRALSTTPHESFCGHLRAPVWSHPSPGRPCKRNDWLQSRMKCRWGLILLELWILRYPALWLRVRRPKHSATVI